MNKKEFMKIIEDPSVFELVEEGTDWNLYRNKIKGDFLIRDLMTNDTITLEDEDIWDLFELVTRMVDIHEVEIKTFNPKDYKTY